MKPSLYFRLIFKRLLNSFLFTYISLGTAFFLIEVFVRRFRHIHEIDLFKYFVSLLSTKADLFMTFSFLTALVFTISTLKERFEVHILQVSGFSKKKILFPFYFFILCSSFFSYANAEWISPKIELWQKFEKPRKKETLSTGITSKVLKDKTRIIYLNKNGIMSDLYWIRSKDEIWHIKEIRLDKDEPEGLFIDVFQRNHERVFAKQASYDVLSLPELFRLGKKKPDLKKSFSLSKMISLLSSDSLIKSSDRLKLKTNLIYKLTHPFYSLIFATLLLPLLYTYHKHFKIYLFYLIALSLFLLFYSIMKTAIILGESNAVSPYISLILLPFLLQGVLSYRLWKT